MYFGPSYLVRIIITALIVGGIVLFIFGALSHAIRVLLRGEYSYDPKARKEAVISAVIALILGIVLFLWLLWRCAM